MFWIWTNACIIQVDSRNNFILALLLHWIWKWAEIPSCLSDYLWGIWSEFEWFWIKQHWNKCPFMSCCFVFDSNSSTTKFSWLLLGILIYYYHAQYMYEDSKLLVPQHIAEWHKILNIDCHWFWLQHSQIFNHITVRR